MSTCTHPIALSYIRVNNECKGCILECRNGILYIYFKNFGSEYDFVKNILQYSKLYRSVDAEGCCAGYNLVCHPSLSITFECMELGRYRMIFNDIPNAEFEIETTSFIFNPK